MLLFAIVSYFIYHNTICLKNFWNCSNFKVILWFLTRSTMRKPVYAVCEEHIFWLDCTSAQSDQNHCCWLHRLYWRFTCHTQSFKILASPARGYITWVQSSTQIKRNDWLLADPCPQATNHCALVWVWAQQTCLKYSRFLLTWHRWSQICKMQ